MSAFEIIEFVSAIFLVIALAGILYRHENTRQSRTLVLSFLSTIIGELLDCIGYVFLRHPLPVVIEWPVYMGSYLGMSLSLGFFIIYGFYYIKAKQNINKWFVYIPMTLVALNLTYLLIMGITGNLFQIKDNMVSFSAIPSLVNLIVNTVVLLYIPILCLVYRKSLGVKNAILMTIFVIIPILSVILLVALRNVDYSYVASSLTLCLVATMIQNRQYIDNAQKQKENLQDENQLLFGKVDEVTQLNNKLEKSIHMIEGVSRVYFASYYIDMTTDTFEELTSRENIRNTVGKAGEAQKNLFLMAGTLVLPDFREIMHAFVDLSTLDERLKDKVFITEEYQGVTTGWTQAYFIAGDRDEHGNLLDVFYTARIIHEEKKKDEMQKEALSNALKRAELANRAKTDFLFNMSHDIRTPMNAIMGFRNLLEKNQEDPVLRQEYLKKIQDSSEVLLSIINNILEMSRIENGSFKADRVAVDIYALTEEICSIFEELIKEKGLTFTIEYNLEHPYIYADPFVIREVLMNLISNAYKYTFDGGITMTLNEYPDDNDMVIIETIIQDTGIGMSEDFLPHIFEEFSREYNTTHTKIEGTGLGMPIVKRLIDQANGSITVDSERGIGTTFFIRISHSIARKEDVVYDNSYEEVNTGSFVGKKILLVEDNDLNAEIAIEILEELGLIVERVENGDIAVHRVMDVEYGTYSLILMDVQMPVMNGYEATRMIRSLEDKEKAGIPIIAMTANAFKEDKDEALNAGMNGHLAKPININDLVQEISKYL